MTETTLCYIRRGGEWLMLHRAGRENDENAGKWIGVGGHIEPGESVVDAVIREMKEETGLVIKAPRLCGIKQFPIEGGRYLVFLFETDQFEGKVVDSEEGRMQWVKKSELKNVKLVDDFDDLIEVMRSDRLTEFQYVVENEKWIVVKK